MITSKRSIVFFVFFFLLSPWINITGKIMTANAEHKTETIVLGMGCFWGAEKRMSTIDGVMDIECGYAGGDEKDAGYPDVLMLEKRIQAGISTARNHAEVIRVSFDPAKVSLETILIHFWENHDPTQGNRQGHDMGSNYRSAIYVQSLEQAAMAEKTRAIYQAALAKAGYPAITTEIAPLKNYITAEEYHQDYLRKNPNGYCGLGGTGVKYPGERPGGNMTSIKPEQTKPLDSTQLNHERQLVVFEAEDCPYCQLFKADIMTSWHGDVPVATSFNFDPPQGWRLQQPVFATPTIVLFEKGQEIARYTGYDGRKDHFWKWLGSQLLTPEQRKIAFEQGTEPPFTGSYLDEKRPGTFVDPITGEALFLSNSKFESGSGWPSFFQPVEGAITLHEDFSHGMKRIEVRSASSGIHLGHVFDDGPTPTRKRYCINGKVLKFVPDVTEEK
jgi:peptide methionine sulfoxide reductase msrA/msrB